MHKVLEQEYSSIADYEQSRQEQIIQQRKQKNKEQYLEIAKQRQVYAKVLKRANENRDSAAALFDSREPSTYSVTSPQS